MGSIASLLLDVRVPRSLSALEGLIASVRSALRPAKPHAVALENIEFGIEEIFTNMVKYNPQGSPNVDVQMVLDTGRVRVDLIDPDSNEFNPWSRPTPEITAPLEDRRPGGLGIHLVKEMLTEVGYEYDNRKSVVTLIQVIH